VSNGPAQQVISLYVSEEKIYPRAVHGWFAAWRWALVWGTQLLFYGLPWLPWNGRQAVLLDLEARRFFIFELVLYPQDFVYLTALLLISAYALFFFTAVAGRLWCGYACPQTVYTELFMWVERQLEGDRIARMKLDAAPWSAKKVLRKGGKHLAWVAIALWTGLTLVGYFTPIRELVPAAATFSLGPWEWFWSLFYGFATWGNAGFMREQVCKYMCPYARFQGAMFDRDTLVIAYDERRGEPRGSRPRSADPRALGKGDCIDCTLCVQVCPTGIDIRDGQQYECIGCAACIDVCNGVMDKMAYPRGLIRYATQNGLAQQLTQAQMWRRVLRPRVLIYGAILLALCVAFVVSLWSRTPFKVDIVRDRATLARQVSDREGSGQIENLYRMQLMNATEKTQRYAIAVAGLDQAQVRLSAAGQASGDAQAEVGPAQALWVTLAVRLPFDSAQRLGPGAHPMQFDVRQQVLDGAAQTSVSITVKERSTFIVPR
jgi:cytochrome c oxidase accessory protein FixG